MRIVADKKRKDLPLGREGAAEEEKEKNISRPGRSGPRGTEQMQEQEIRRESPCP